MNYAMVSGGAVVNVIVGPLPAGIDGIPARDVPVGIGDQYADGVFLRGGVALLTPLEDAQAQVAVLDAAYVALEYDYAMLQLGIAS